MKATSDIAQLLVKPLEEVRIDEISWGTTDDRDFYSDDELESESYYEEQINELLKGE